MNKILREGLKYSILDWEKIKQEKKLKTFIYQVANWYYISLKYLTGDLNIGLSLVPISDKKGNSTPKTSLSSLQ